MKCHRCGEELTEETAAFYHGKPYCRKYCFNKVKYEDTHFSIDDMKMIAKRRWSKGI